MTPDDNEPKRESMLLNLALNIVIPTVILTKFSGDQHLGAQWGIVVALAFPIIYGLYDFRRTGKINLFSALGILSIFLTGGISLLELDPQYIVIKEAGIPAIFGLVTLASIKTRYPLVKTFLYNDKVLQVGKVDSALDQHGTKLQFDGALTNATYMIAVSFFLSSLLNYALAKYLLVSPPGTEEFNAELGKMTALSFPVIALPATVVMMMAFFYLFKRIKALTHLDLDDILIAQ